MGKKLSERLQCVCSTIGFESEHWNEHYYPDECPPDWRMAYFMNDFHAVYLPDVDWFENFQLLEEFVEELDDNFELVLQWPSGITPRAINDALIWLAPLAQNIACMVLPVDAQSPSQLKQCVQAFSGKYPVNLDCTRPVSAEILMIAEEFGAGYVWRGDGESRHLMMGDYQLVILPCPDLRLGTAMLRVLQKAGGEQARIGVFLEAAAQSPQRALELRTVIELMGMA